MKHKWRHLWVDLSFMQAYLSLRAYLRPLNDKSLWIYGLKGLIKPLFPSNILYLITILQTQRKYNG